MTDDLSPAGYFRAANLDQVFGKGRTQPGYNTPDVIYAMKAKPVRLLIPPLCAGPCFRLPYLPVDLGRDRQHESFASLCILSVEYTQHAMFSGSTCCSCCRLIASCQSYVVMRPDKAAAPAPV